jgi:hypothetical protein
MRDLTLKPFWIVSPDPHGPLGFGVTAFSLEEALQIIRDAGYLVPENTTLLRVEENVKVSDIDERHVVKNMGPIVVRGIWYPFSKVGI